ncbi:MAG: FadR family transcriptional regulator [Oscillibacter sp.]|jgi:GntR family transcriptional repressor for pyruvate dehydrogenase complex|nr:FadR family transcriptional regulator [Oscillibacter sp.]
MQLEKIQYNQPKVPELVMQSLIAAIDKGDISVGGELPSERDLAETLGVGRGSLRECLAILEFLGAVENRGNRKIVTRDADYIQKAMSFVRVSNQADMQEDFNEFRRISEVAIVGLACERATAEDLRTLEGILRDLEAAPGDYMNDVRFHDALAVASHNMMLAATIHLVTSMIAEIRIRFFGRPDYQRRSMESHIAIYEAVKAHDVERAKREMKLHLDIVEEFAQKYPKEV